VVEQVARGAFDALPRESVRAALEECWERAVASQVPAFASAQALVPPEPPPEWPKYFLLRARVVRRAEELVEVRRDTAGRTAPKVSAVAVERALTAADGRLHGRPDRVERSAARLTVVDFKTGTLDDEVSPAHRRQLLFYAYLVHESEGVWAEEGAVEGVDGWRRSIDVSPAEASEVAEDALSSMDEFNAAAARGAVEECARPSAESCRFCPYSGACRAFLSAVDATWDVPGASFEGPVVGTSSTAKEGVLTVVPVRGTCRPGIPVRLLRVPLSENPPLGVHASVTHAGATAAPADFVPRWDTQLWEWV
jgi:hypothetical protein